MISTLYVKRCIVPALPSLILTLTFSQLLLVWTPGKGSPIHDHANAHCVMKILKGRLTETVYAWPCEDPANPTACATAADSAYPSTAHTCSSRRGSQGIGPAELEVTKETMYATDQVTYMSDSIGLHRIRNPSNEEFAVSLHLYTVSLFPQDWTERSLADYVTETASQCREARLSHLRSQDWSEVACRSMSLLLRVRSQDGLMS